MLRSKQNEDLLQIERKLSFVYGIVIFMLILIVFLSSVYYFNFVINKEQHRLSTVIANSIGDSINKISFSGKYQARLLIEEFVNKNPNIESIIIQDLHGEVIAHSDKKSQGAIIIDEQFKKALETLKDKNYQIQKIKTEKNGKNIELLEIDMPYKKGYEETPSGIIRVFLYTDILSGLINDGIIYFSILISILALLSIPLVRIISNKIGAPIKDMAYMLNGILQNSPAGIFISNKNGKIIANSHAMPELQSRFETDEDREISKDVFLKGVVKSYDLTIILNNQIRYFHAFKTPIAFDEEQKPSLACTIAIDITEQKEYETKIKMLLAEQTAFFQNAVAGIAHIKNGVFIKCNEAWEQMLGFDPKELEGKKLATIYNSEDEYKKTLDELSLEVAKSGYFKKEQRLRKKDGAQIFTLISGAYLDANDFAKGSIWVAIEITDRKHMEEELLLINKNLEERVSAEIKKRLKAEQMALQQSKMALMGEMIGAIAHQWRQPLNALAIAVQDIKEAYKYNELTEEYINETVSLAMNRISFMSQTIDDFRNFFSPNKSKDTFNIEDAIRNVLKLIDAQLKNYEITVEFKEYEKTEFFGYKNELQQVLLNIISNAKDAIESNKSTIKRIEIAVVSTNQDIFITIEDSGGGIPTQIIERIWEPYYTTKEQGKGTGIGLYMSKQIIERHLGGELSATNGEFGAKFTIKLPKNL